MDTLKEEVQHRIASEMNHVYYFSNILALKYLYPTSQSDLQNHKGHLHIKSIRKRKCDRQLELTNCNQFDTSSNCLEETPFSGTR